MDLRSDAMEIARQAVEAVLPEQAVQRALAGYSCQGKTVVIAVGKAAWRMADAARGVLGEQIDRGLVVTKYGHSQGKLANFRIIEAGHPLPDENSLLGARLAIEAVRGLSENDKVLLLLSGGGSALFELPAGEVSLDEMIGITRQLLASGASIVEVNTIRKHLSAVKGGKFAAFCTPACVSTIILSDVVGDRLDSIASGPTVPDASTCEEARAIVERCGIRLSPEAWAELAVETPKKLERVETNITGNVTALCKAAALGARRLGYHPLLLSDTLECEAREAGRFLAAIARTVRGQGSPAAAPCAVIVGGETVVHLSGDGKGGRNQELVLSAAQGIAGLGGVLILSLGSDGTDGPTDAAGGMVDGETLECLAAAGVDYQAALDNHDSYHALLAADGLIMTGPTGTNVNDLMMILCN